MNTNKGYKISSKRGDRCVYMPTPQEIAEAAWNIRMMNSVADSNEYSEKECKIKTVKTKGYLQCRMK